MLFQNILCYMYYFHVIFYNMKINNILFCVKCIMKFTRPQHPIAYVPTPLFNQPNYIPQTQQNCYNFDFLNHPAYQQVYQKNVNLNFGQLNQYDNFSISDVQKTPVNNQ